jgi:hypothetical protein
MPIDSSAAPCWRGVALVLLLVISVACRGSAASGPPEIRLVTPDDQKAVVEVVNLSDDIARRFASGERSRDQWAEILRVSTGDDQPAMLGSYSVSGHTLRFTPMFPFDPGRKYSVTFNPAGISEASAATSIVATVALPAIATEPSTVVTHVFPSTDVVPENQLRLYIHFSAPMAWKGGLEFVKLLDAQGVEVVDPFLPLDAEFWNDDRTRYTVFFDPGRQKRGILPNQQMGRSLTPGQRYTLVVSRDWRDADGLPLKEDFRREFRVAKADERPLDVSAWRVTPPPADTREALVVAFPEPLDHGLLLRALGVTGEDGRFLDGDVKVDAGESRWSFTPRTAWRAATYQLTALTMLEDLAGNRIGRAFEVDRFDRTDESNEPERTTIGFKVAGPR